VYDIDREELYVLDRDPGERSNEVATRPGDVARLRARSVRWMQEHGWEEASSAFRRSAVPPAVQEELDALGYLP
jgi:hypothetical protein